MYRQAVHVDGVLNGPAVLEKPDQTVEMGEYKNNRMDGIWRIRKPNGDNSTKTYFNGESAIVN